jgi:hypothetical protein
MDAILKSFSISFLLRSFFAGVFLSSLIEWLNKDLKMHWKLREFPLLQILEMLQQFGIIILVLEGRRIAFGASRKRKVRTPSGVMPRNSGFDRRYTRAES